MKIITYNLAETIRDFEASGKDIRSAVGRAAETIRDELDKRYRPTYATWSGRPIDVGVFTSRNRWDATVTSDKIFMFVDEGTRPHPIYPVRARRLHFLSGYTAKTSPGSLRSQAGGPYGDDVFAHAVHHPGTEARRFTEIVADRAKGFVPKILSNELQKMLEG